MYMCWIPPFPTHSFENVSRVESSRVELPQDAASAVTYNRPGRVDPGVLHNCTKGILPLCYDN